MNLATTIILATWAICIGFMGVMHYKMRKRRMTIKQLDKVIAEAKKEVREARKAE